MNRRELIKWAFAVRVSSALLPAKGLLPEPERDMLVGVSSTCKKVADLSGNAVTFRCSEDDEFLRCMEEMWRTANGTKPYVTSMVDRGIVGEHDWRDDAGNVHHQPEAYVTEFVIRSIT